MPTACADDVQARWARQGAPREDRGIDGGSRFRRPGQAVDQHLAVSHVHGHCASLAGCRDDECIAVVRAPNRTEQATKNAWPWLGHPAVRRLMVLIADVAPTVDAHLAERLFANGRFHAHGAHSISFEVMCQKCSGAVVNGLAR